jgi:hypothetical protein
MWVRRKICHPSFSIHTLSIWNLMKDLIDR